MTNTSYRTIFALVLLVLLAIRIYILAHAIWPINGDEAQYWNWSTNLAWGYYSKPPMIAWVIAGTTKFFGSGSLGLRLGSTLAYVIAAIFVYLTGTRLFSERVGFWSGLSFILVPGITYSSSIISTDPLLLMFWSIAFYFLVIALDQDKLIYWLLAGVALGLAFYSKYAAILFIFSLILYLCLSKQHRRLWCSAGPYILILVPFIMLIPNLLWNYHHQFASLNAVSANAEVHSKLFQSQNFLNFFLAQFALFGPVLFVVLLIIIGQIKKIYKNERYLLLLVFSLLTLVVMTIESIIARAHANWSAPAYIAATILVCAVLIERKKIFWLWLALILNCAALLGFMNIQTIVKTFHIQLDQEMTITGWHKVVPEINRLRHFYSNTKVVTDNRMLMTQLMYNAHIPLNKIIRWNPSGNITDQYDMITSMQNQQGNNFLFITYSNNPYQIKNYFRSIKFITKLKLQTLDGKNKNLYIYYLVGFEGY